MIGTKTMKKISNELLLQVLRFALPIGLRVPTAPAISFGQALERSGFGPNPAPVQPPVDAFRADLGELDPNNGQSFTSGRREVNWDHIPNQVTSELGFLPPNDFNSNAPAGTDLDSTARPAFGAQIQRRSLSHRAETGAPVRFGNIDPSNTNEFQTFLAQRRFSSVTYL